MAEIVNFLLEKKELLTVGNFVLAFCIIFHLFCEFAHYVHEFICRRRDAERFKDNNRILLSIFERIEKIERKIRL